MTTPPRLSFREAIRKGDAAEVQAWVKREPALCEQIDLQNRTPLMLAAQHLHPEVLSILLPLSDPSLVDLNGNDALQLAVDLRYNDCESEEAEAANALACVRLLLPVSDPLRVNNKGLTALMLAARSHADLVQALLALSNPKVTDPDQWSALFFAADTGNADCVRLLLPVSDPLACDITGQTPLLRACCSSAGDDTPATVRLLLPVSDPSARDNRGQTTLMNAAGFAHDSLLPLLLPFCDPQACNAKGLTAFDIVLDSLQRVSTRGALRGFTRTQAWHCLDFLAPFAPRDKVLPLLNEEPTRFPRFRAFLEREALSETLAPRQPDVSTRRSDDVSITAPVAAGLHPASCTDEGLEAPSAASPRRSPRL